MAVGCVEQPHHAASQEASEVDRLKLEVAQLHKQLAEVKRVDEQELDKLWQLAGEQSSLGTRLQDSLPLQACTCFRLPGHGLDVCRAHMVIYCIQQVYCT